ARSSGASRSAWWRRRSSSSAGRPATCRSSPERMCYNIDSMPRVPRIRAPVRGSRTGRPAMVLLDLLGRRWALRVLWELREGPLTSRALRAACGGISPTVLNERLFELREARLVRLDEPAGYQLTPLGRELFGCVYPLVRWADRWADELRRSSPG